MGTGKLSAGLLLFRRRDGLEVFLVHPGGPFFAGKDEGVWTVPKGEIDPGEDALRAAEREFEEETGLSVAACASNPKRIALGSIRQRGDKTVEAWAFEGDWPPGTALRSNRFSIEWPPRSGQMKEFPEVDQGGFFTLLAARRKINPAQVELLDRLSRIVAGA